MSKDLDMILDECIDRMNKGGSLEDCLRSYPEHAAELRPLLQVVFAAHQAGSSIPRAGAKSTGRKRLDAAIAKHDRGRGGHQKRRRIVIPSFGWPRAWAVVSIVLLLTLVGFGLHWGITPGATPASAQANFRLLVSDVENAIGDFKALDVTVSSIGVVRGGESDRWETIELEPHVVLDLTRLQGLNAQEVWKGILPEGQYTKLFINIDGAIGILNNDQTVNIIVPSGYMQISKPFEVITEDPVVDFVFDITVVSTGNGQSDGNYILLPQIKQSGASQTIHEIDDGNLTLQIIGGNITAGGNVTLLVTFEGNPVAGALVTVNNHGAGNTTVDGRISFIVPSAEELKIKAVKGELEGELEIDLEHEPEQGNLTLQIVSGNMTAGSNVTVLVTFDGNPVAGALVTVNNHRVGNTTADGRISFIVPSADELKIQAEKGELEGELEIDLEQEPQEGRLTIQVVNGNMAPGGNITVLVTFQGNPVAGAAVTVNDYDVGNTTVDGRISLIVPLDDELEIKAVKGELEGELEINLEQEANGPEHEGDGQEQEVDNPGHTDNNGQEQEANDSGHDGNSTEQEANGPEHEANGPEQETNGSGHEGNSTEQERYGPEHEANGPLQEANGSGNETNGDEDRGPGHDSNDIAQNAVAFGSLTLDKGFSGACSSVVS